MTQLSDIESLFQKFGGDTDSYQEIGRESDSQAARHRWPVLGAIDLSQAAALPPVESSANRPARPAMTLPTLSRFAPPAVTPMAPARPEVVADDLRFTGIQAQAPVAESAPQAAASPAASRPPVSRFGVPPASGSTPSVSPAPTDAAAPQPAAAASHAQPMSILRKMVGATAATAAPPDTLPALFARLLDEPGQAAASVPDSPDAPTPHWLARGPRRP